MTPFGARLRELRAERGVALKDMAESLGVTPTYLSALEHGRRGRPNWGFVQRVIHYFNIIWDDAEELLRLADVSHPRVTVDTSGLSPEATRMANKLARGIGRLGADDIAAIDAVLDAAQIRARG